MKSEKIIELVESKIPKIRDQVSNKMLLLRYIERGLEISNWTKKFFKNTNKLSILDFGCGEGQLVIILNEMGFVTKGIDVHEFVYWKNIEAKFDTYDGENLPYESSSFDVILLNGVLEHIGKYPRDIKKFDEYQEARIRMLLAVKRVLKDNGLIFIYDFPNPNSPIEFINEMLHLPNVHEKSDKQSLWQVEKLVKDAGFSILKSGRKGTLPAYYGKAFPFIKYKIINKYYKVLGKIDKKIDAILGNFLGQSNFIIAQKQN